MLTALEWHGVLHLKQCVMLIDVLIGRGFGLAVPVRCSGCGADGGGCDGGCAGDKVKLVQALRACAWCGLTCGCWDFGILWWWKEVVF